MDFYQFVPRSLNANLEYRVDIRRRAQKDLKFRRAMIQACREDVLFFFGSFCFLQEPRPMKDDDGRPLPDVIPFIPWPHQEPVIRSLRENLGHTDIGIEKARGEGMSWIAVLLALHDWVFAIQGTRTVKISFVSRNEDSADNPDDPGSLGYKLDWELSKLPQWMVGVKGRDYIRNLTKHTWRNLQNDSVITAYAATGEVGSGSRDTWFLLDELSKFPPGKDHDAVTATQQTTKSRLVIATPNGAEGAYYKFMHEPNGNMVRLVLDWKDNPTRNRGLYKFVAGKPVALDAVANPLPPHYNPPNQATLDLFSRLRRKGFNLEKGTRSPWYDNECDRGGATPHGIAQELDRDYGGSMYKIFPDAFFSETKRTVCNPFCKVRVEYDDSIRDPTVYVEEDGQLQLWMRLDSQNRPAQHPYVVGVDVCTGLGGTYTSNSVIEIIDALTAEQVGEFASNTTEPSELAELAVAICDWLGGAYLAWEKNGPGNAFSKRIKDIGYPNVYYRTAIFHKRRKKAKEAGWWTDEKTKEVMFSELGRSVLTTELKIRSKLLSDECAEYVRVGKAIEHVANARKEGGSDVGAAHGDRVMAFGVAVQALRDRPVDVKQIDKPAPPPGTMEYRDMLFREAQRVDKDDWDPRSNWDMLRSY